MNINNDDDVITSSLLIIDRCKTHHYFNLRHYQYQDYHYICRHHCLLSTVHCLKINYNISSKNILSSFTYSVYIYFTSTPFAPHSLQGRSRRQNNGEDNLNRYLYLLLWPYSAGTENILRGIVQGPSKVPDEIFYQLVLK